VLIDADFMQKNSYWHEQLISKFENSDYRLYANEKESYHDRAFATFGKKYLKMNGYL
jgi:hypothetical protein